MFCSGDRIFVLVYVKPNQNDRGDEIKKMPDVDLAIVIRHCRCAAAKTELCVTVFRFFELWFLSIPESSRRVRK
jgi:hypothetical protein